MITTKSSQRITRENGQQNVKDSQQSDHYAKILTADRRLNTKGIRLTLITNIPTKYLFLQHPSLYTNYNKAVLYACINKILHIGCVVLLIISHIF